MSRVQRPKRARASTEVEHEPRHSSKRTRLSLLSESDTKIALHTTAEPAAATASGRKRKNPSTSLRSSSRAKASVAKSAKRIDSDFNDDDGAAGAAVADDQTLEDVAIASAGRANPKRSAREAAVQVEVSSRAEWREWLSQNHGTSTGIWLVTMKKAAGGVVEYAHIVQEALCFGWIDSTARRLDDLRRMIWLSPRKPKSNWSAVNKAFVHALEQQGLMAPAGAAMVAHAKRSGTWDALNEVNALKEPDDLLQALSSYSKAQQHWNAFPPSTRRAILEWIHTAKRAATRDQRVAETARLAQQNVRANQWPRVNV